LYSANYSKDFAQEVFMGLRWLFISIIFLFVPATSSAGEAIEQIRQTSDKIIAIFKDPEMMAPEKKAERNRMLRKAVDERFDWEELSRRSLARHWAKRTEQEKKEFIALFGKLLENTYMDRVDEYSGQEVTYGAEKLEGEYGVVEIRIITRNKTAVPVLYRVKKKGNEWLVYDISVEGVSLVNNYRNQFNSIIARHSYDHLVELIREKVGAVE
jgi:phospholipid transport system substrate-binding protein